MHIPQATDKGTGGTRRLLHFYLIIWGGFALAVLVIVVAGYGDYYKQWDRPPDPPGVQTLTPPEPAPAFALVDQQGRPFTQAQLAGKWTLLFFGYTHCPDFCPTTLAAFNAALRRLQREDPALAAGTRIVFVSLDPFRDTPAVLANYVAHFNPSFIGASGPPEELYRLTAALGMHYDYADPDSDAAFADTLHRPPRDYVVNHGAGFYVFDERARVVAWVLPPHSPERIVSVFKHSRSVHG